MPNLNRLEFYEPICRIEPARLKIEGRIFEEPSNRIFFSDFPEDTQPGDLIKFEIETEAFSDDPPYVEYIEVCRLRPETDLEMHKRVTLEIAQEQRQAQRDKIKQREEYDTYISLKQKFEGC